MQNYRRLDLQLFAEASAASGTGGGEAAAGVSAADAGQQNESRDGQRPDTAQQSKTEEKRKPAWEELLQDPEYRAAFDSRVQGIIRQRLGRQAQLQQRFETLQPALAVLAERYGLDPDKPDYERLSAAIREEGEASAAAERRADPQPLLAHYRSLREQAERFRAQQPDFDLDRELGENEAFVRMTAPQVGLSVADAYFAAHRDRILAERDRETLSAVTSTILAGRNRPRENSGGGAGPTAPLSYRQLNAQQRRAFKARLEQSWARGEKPPVGF